MSDNDFEDSPDTVKVPRKKHVRLSDHARTLVKDMSKTGARNTDLAKIFGVTAQTITNIVRG